MKIKLVTSQLILVFILLTCCKTPKKQLEVSNAVGYKKPNIVFILTDQWRGSALGYAGDPNVSTPNLDAFSKEAVNFTNAVSVTPVCTPHRAALLTGRFPTTTGMFVNDIYLPSEELCMAEIFKAEGYSTAYWGKWHLDGHGRQNNVMPERRQGFDYWKGAECDHNYSKEHYYANNDPEKKYWEGYSPFAIVKDANEYISSHAKDQNPFLMLISLATPHYPHDSAPKKYKDMYPQETLKLRPNVPKELEVRTREELQGYYGHCTATDEAIGNVLNKIKELGIWDNTIIVFSADHGEMMGSHGVRPFVKQMAWDESVRVPFLISYPEIGKHKGTTVMAPINTPDILPSLLGLSNIEIPKTIEGENLSKLIKNPDTNADRAALVMNVAPFTGNYKDAPFRAIRTKQYTYIKTKEGSNLFFDDIKDPYQMNNLFDNAQFEDVRKDLEGKLNRALNKIGDEFKSRDYYLNKWGYDINNSRHAVDYWSWEKGEGVLQSPKK
ncbi:sulfatase family protein [Siansivirga zeaxanthinifaciens]|uniref:Sulfatase n=1 Tax=Siansivirga zeaxanthinifaciens CC-SAMT-1 TaxID=1454006 RepID=A0A0C5WBI9_9FLAO|nr:sulfatase [Siansivirga zeaxanthinifaciens]AJR04478.1 sulfatase [Siansivirga zeaxanthinifaciens CC-SAMT-1]